MPTPTYDLIASNVLSSSVNSVTFSGISGSYRDLVLVINSLTSANSAMNLKINSDTGANYNYVLMAGDGSSAISDSGSGQTYGVLNAYAQFNTTNPTVFIAQFMDYSATDKHKSWLSRGNNSGGAVEAIAGRWASTSAITSLEIYLPASRTFNSGGTFYLYGLVS